MIICSTGLQLPRELFETITIKETTMKCPACGKVHVWTKKDAFLRDA